MAEAVQPNLVATLDVRMQALAHTLKTKLAQGYTVESQRDTEALIVTRGRKRFLKSSSETRQILSVDEAGIVTCKKVDSTEDA